MHCYGVKPSLVKFWRSSQQTPVQSELGTASRQPAFLAPRAVVILIASLAVIHLARGVLTPGFDRFILIMLGVLPIRYLAGPEGVIFLFPGGLTTALLPFVTHAFLHANFMHLAMNSAWLLAFGTAVSRRLGTGKFLLLYGICAIAGAALHIAFSPGSKVPMIGASGAISGMMGAAFRIALPAIMDGRQALHATITPLSDRRLQAICGVWIVVNILLGVSGLRVGEEVLLIAWDAHIGGFVAGLLLIGPFARPWRKSAMS